MAQKNATGSVLCYSVFYNLDRRGAFMEWTMFIIFFVTNLLICLIFRVTYSSFGKYDKGMVLAVHIPKEFAEVADVQAIAA